MINWQVKEALDELYDVAGNIKDLTPEYNIVMENLTKGQEDTQVLDLIIKKCIGNHNLAIVARSDNYGIYCAWFTNTYDGTPVPELTEAEFEMIKRKCVRKCVNMFSSI